MLLEPAIAKDGKGWSITNESEAAQALTPAAAIFSYIALFSAQSNSFRVNSGSGSPFSSFMK